MAFWDLATLPLAEFRPGIHSAALSGDNLIMVCMEIGPEQEDTGHAHAFDQCGMVLAGEIEMFSGQERRLLAAGHCYFIPAGERHGWKTFAAPARLLDVTPKQPPR